MPASQFDPLRPRADLSNVRPHYEDRVLVRWVPPPAAPSIIATPTAPNQRDTGPQHGIVVAVGAGNTGITKTVVGRDGGPVAKIKRFRGGGRVPPTVAPGDRVIYTRVPDQEFEHEGVLHTFLFEEQNILGILEAA